MRYSEMIVDVLKQTRMMNEPFPDEKCPPAPSYTDQNSRHWHFAIAPSVVAFHCWPRWPVARTSLKAMNPAIEERLPLSIQRPQSAV